MRISLDASINTFQRRSFIVRRNIPINARYCMSLVVYCDVSHIQSLSSIRCEVRFYSIVA